MICLLQFLTFSSRFVSNVTGLERRKHLISVKLKIVKTASCFAEMQILDLIAEARKISYHIEFEKFLSNLLPISKVQSASRLSFQEKNKLPKIFA